MFGEIIMLCALASLLQLTRHELGPFLLHRPLATGILLGAPFGLIEVGFLVGACLEFVWVDRIPAGGIRVPATGIGLAAALAALLVIRHHQGADFTPLQYAPFALIIATIYTVLFVPLDGGLRRLWNVASENVVLALDRGSVAELRAYAPVVLCLRWTVVTLGLLTAPALTMMLGDWLYDPHAPMASIAWSWIIPAAIAAFILRRNRRFEPILGVILFLAGWVLGGGV